MPNERDNRLDIGDWSNGMTRVSKTFSGSSILSSPVIAPDFISGEPVGFETSRVLRKENFLCFPGMPILCGFPGFLFLQKIICSTF